MSCAKHFDKEDAINARGLCLLCDIESLRAQLAAKEREIARMASLLSGQQLESFGWKCPRCPSPHPNYDCAYPDCLQPPRTGE